MIKALDHIGLSVVSIDRSVQFYRDLLGMHLVVEEPFEGALYDRIMALRGARGRVVLLKSPRLQLELFEFSEPTPQTGAPDRPVSDHGITHFCVEVADIDLEYDRLQAAGVVFHCPPLVFPGGEKATYARDPDGNVFELLQLCGTNASSSQA